jgi:hypothetical protein
MGNMAEEGVDAVPGDEGPGARQLCGDLDDGGVEADLLLSLAYRGRREIGVIVVAPPAREGDLAGVAAQVGAPLGEDEAGLAGPPVERQQDRRLDLAPQMITWTVPPSTDQAAPLT